MKHNPLSPFMSVTAYVLIPVMAYLWYSALRNGLLSTFSLVVLGGFALIMILLLGLFVLPTRMVITSNSLEQTSLLGKAMSIPWNQLATVYIYGKRETLLPNSFLCRILGLVKTWYFVKFYNAAGDGFIEVRLEKRSAAFLQNILARIPRVEYRFEVPDGKVNPREQWNKLLGTRYEQRA